MIIEGIIENRINSTSENYAHIIRIVMNGGLYEKRISGFDFKR